MANAFLLDEKQRKYFKLRSALFFKAMKKAGLTPETITEDNIEKTIKHLRPSQFSPKNILKKIDPLLKGNYFSLLYFSKYSTSPREWAPGDSLRDNEFVINGQLTFAYREWYYITHGPNEQLSFKMPQMTPIEEGTPAFNLLESSATWKSFKGFEDPDEEDVIKIQEYLGLQDYPFLDLSTNYDLNILAAVCSTMVQQAGAEIPQQIITVSPPPYFGEGFNTIRQGIATNTLATLRPNIRGNTDINGISHTATITTNTKHGDFSLQLPIEQLKGLKTSTLQLLDALVIELTETGAKTRSVNLSLADYMEKRGLKDRKSAKEQFLSDLVVLSHSAITWIEKRNGTLVPYSGVSIGGSWRLIDRKKTVVSFSFGEDFYKVLLGYPVMPYPAQLQTINAKRNPNSYNFLKKIAEYKNMNATNPVDNYGDVISVKTLLSVAPYIPTYEDVMRSNRNLMARIVEPFMRDMNALSETLDWHFCHSKGVELTKAEEKEFEYYGIPYDVFMTLFVKITWNQYPDQTKKEDLKKPDPSDNDRKKPAKK